MERIRDNSIAYIGGIGRPHQEAGEMEILKLRINYYVGELITNYND